MVACYFCNGGAGDLMAFVQLEHVHVCKYHNPMSDYNWNDEDIDDPEKLLDLLDAEIDEADRSQLDAEVADRVDKWNGLVNRPAACHLVGRDYGVEINDVLGTSSRSHTIKDLNNCEVNEDGYGISGIYDTYKVRRIEGFGTGEDWKRADLVVYDDTGEIDLTLWNDMADAAESLSTNDEIKVKNGFVEDGDYGRSLNIKRKGALILPDGTEVEGPDA